MASIRFLVLACLILIPGVLRAEEPADAVRALLPWTRDIIGKPFFIGRACEAVLQQGGPWRESDRIVPAALRQLNDYLGHRPVAVLRTKDPRKGYLIQDSSGFGGCDRCTKWVRKIDFRKAWFIHPPKKIRNRGL